MKQKGHIRNVVRNVVQDMLLASVVVDIAIPGNALRNADGTPVRNDDGSYIRTR